MKQKHPVKEYKLKIGSNIRKWRDLKNMKQKDLAAALHLSEAAISNIENDKANISLQQLEDISLILNIPVAQLFSDPLQNISIPLNGKIVAEQHPKHSYLLDAVITSMQKKDEQLEAFMKKILHHISLLAPQKEKE